MKKTVRVLLYTICLAVCMALPTFAAEYGEPNITPQMTMKEIRANPSIAGCGISTYGNGDADSLLLRRMFENRTLERYVSASQAEDCAAGLNLAIQNYNAGIQVTYQVYTPEEIAADSSLGAVQLYYFPSDTPGSRYAVVLGGNVAMTSGELREGVATAAQLHEMGYTVFVLRHSIWLDLENNGPLRDLGRAVQFIDQHAQQFSVQRENYALFGYSSGGHLIGLFGSEQPYGYRAYDVPQPGALILSYAVNDFSEVKPVYHAIMDTGVWDWRYYWSSISSVVTQDYPPVYFWYGENDWVLPLMVSGAQGPALQKALEEHDVPYEMRVYANASHAVGIGRGTDAEGWITDAVAFWEQQIAA